MLYEVYDINSTFFSKGVKNKFLFLKSLTFEHILAKRIIYEIYTPYEGARSISIQIWEIKQFKIEIISFIVNFS